MCYSNQNIQQATLDQWFKRQKTSEESNLAESTPPIVDTNERNDELSSQENDSELFEEAVGGDESDANVQQESDSQRRDFSFDKEFKDCMEIFKVVKNGKSERYIRCKICMASPNTVKMNCDNNKPPPMTTELGTRYRNQ